MDYDAVEEQEKMFYVKNGSVLRSVEELFEELQVIEQEDFEHHFSEEYHGGNDFAEWIEHVIGDKFLAERVRRCEDREGLAKEIFAALFK